MVFGSTSTYDIVFRTTPTIISYLDLYLPTISDSDLYLPMISYLDQHYTINYSLRSQYQDMRTSRLGIQCDLI
jgi:hypothetical protein